MLTVYVVLWMICLYVLPVVVWYFFSLPLVKGGMVYGRNTLLYTLVLLLLHAIDEPWPVQAERMALYLLLLVACSDGLYALLMQWKKVADVVQNVYNLVADYAAFVCMLLAYPAFLLSKILVYADKPLIGLFYAANVASIAHNIRLVRKGDHAAIGMILLSAVIMMALILIYLFDPFTLPLS